MKKTSFPFEQFDSPIHQAWKKDRQRRQRVPLTESWRGCVGLAMLWRDVDDASFHGDKVFYDNDNLTWGCLRDVPPGHFPSSASMNRRGVLYSSITKATLKYGMPIIDFAAPTHLAWDLSFMPFDVAVTGTNGHTRAWAAAGDVLNSRERQREFSVFTQLTDSMTRFAASGVDREGRHVRPAWSRLLGNRYRRAPRVVSPDRWFPEPYLGFALDDAEQLYWAATNCFAKLATAYPCPCCSVAIESWRLQGLRSSVVNGGFVARCPNCGESCHWDVDSAVAGRGGRYFSQAFRDGFCAAVADALPLRATEALRYLGVRPADEENDSGHGSDLLAHRFTTVLGDSTIISFLPRSACVLLRQDQVVEAGEIWCNALPVPQSVWSQQRRHDQWTTLSAVCGCPRSVGFFQQLWFANQQVRLAKHPALVFIPAGLVGNAVREIRPRHLVWECGRCDQLVDSESEAVLFPPIRTKRWDRLHFNIRDVVIDASIGDPRFVQAARGFARPPSFGTSVPKVALAV